MKKIFSISLWLFVAASAALSQSAWSPVNSGTSANLNAVCGPFSQIPADTGIYYRKEDPGALTNYFIAGDSGKILWSSDNGDQWSVVPTGTAENLNAVSFFFIDTGCAVGDNGTILRLAKSGEGYAHISSVAPELQDLNHVALLKDGILGYIVGDSGLILRTGNRGSSWVPYQYTRFPYDLREVDFKIFTTAWAAGNSGTILKSTTQKSWIPKVPPEEMPNANFNACAFIRDTGWVVGDLGAIGFTMTGGNIFSKQFPPPGSEKINFNDIFFGSGLDENPNLVKYRLKEGYIVGDSGLILKTTNYGYHWFRQESGTTRNLNNIFMSDTLNGIIVGDSGLILKTTSGGENSPIISAFPAELWFGKISYLSSKAGEIIVTNNGVSDLIITSIVSSNTAFVIDETNIQIPMDETRQIGVTYYPTEGHDDSALISIAGNFNGSPLVIKAYGSSFTSLGTEWRDQNPMSLLPTARGIDCSDSVLIAAGESGSILISSDNGGSFRKMNFIGGSLSQLNCFEFIDRGTGIAAGQNGVIIKTTDAGASWTGKPSNSTMEFIDMAFRDESVGYLLARDPSQKMNSAVYRTSDGGESWNLVKTVSRVSLNSLTLIGQSTVTAVGGGMLRSTDDGTTWQLLICNISYVEMLKTIFFDDTSGFGILGGTGVVTTDGGLSWSWRQLSGTSAIGEIVRTGLNSACAYGSDGTIFKTGDRGQTWQSSGSRYRVGSVAPIDPVNSVAIGYDLVRDVPVLLRCENGLPSGRYESAAPVNDLFSVSFSDQNNGAAAGPNGTLIITTDGGDHWKDYLRGSFFDYLDIPFMGVESVNDSTVTCISQNGDILRTTDGGLTWGSQYSDFRTVLNATYFLDEMNGYCVGDEGLILHTADGGVSWSSQANPTRLPLFAVKFLDPQNGIAAGWKGIILRTTNGGVDWSPRPSGTAATLFCIGWQGDRVISAGKPGTIVLSTDGGDNWEEVYSGTIKPLNSISMRSEENAFIVGGGGIILRTTDGGISWLEQLSGTSYDLYSVHMQNDTIGTVVGENGIILRTTSGGMSQNMANFVQLPDVYSLGQNYPNPFNPATKFRFRIASPGLVTLKIYDILGREVRTLLDEFKEPGSYDASWDASDFSSGVYFYRLQSGSFTNVKKMVLMR